MITTCLGAGPKARPEKTLFSGDLPWLLVVWATCSPHWSLELNWTLGHSYLVQKLPVLEYEVQPSTTKHQLRTKGMMPPNISNCIEMPGCHIFVERGAQPLSWTKAQQPTIYLKSQRIYLPHIHLKPKGFLLDQLLQHQSNVDKAWKEWNSSCKEKFDCMWSHLGLWE